MPKRATLVWTRPALDALLYAMRYIKWGKPLAAQRFAAPIKIKVGRLEKFSEAGRLVSESPASGLRQLVVGEYRISYRAQQRRKRVEILTVRHSAQLLKRPIDAP